MKFVGRAPTNTKQKLIDTASELIWQNSYGSVSVDDICKAADVKKGSFYHYFPSKVDLAIAAMEDHFIHDMKPALDEIFSPSIPAVERYEKLADFIYEEQAKTQEQYGRVCGCPFATLGSEMAGQEETIRAKTDDVFKSCRRYHENALRDLIVDGLLEEAVDVNVRASEIETYIMGQLMMARIQNNLDPLKRDLKTGLFRILDINYEIKEAV